MVAPVGDHATGPIEVNDDQIIVVLPPASLGLAMATEAFLGLP
jgi:hypothetical protein